MSTTITLFELQKIDFEYCKDVVKELVEKDIRLFLEWKGYEVEELSVLEDHVDLVISIPPKGIRIFRNLEEEVDDKIIQELFCIKVEVILGKKFGARVYFVSSIILNEDVVRRYLKHQKNEIIF